MSDNAANLIESLQAELDSREEYSVCDCCECLTTDPVDAGGHIQCPSCTKVANLEHERDRYREALEEIKKPTQTAAIREGRVDPHYLMAVASRALDTPNKL